MHGDDDADDVNNTLASMCVAWSFVIVGLQSFYLSISRVPFFCRSTVTECRALGDSSALCNQQAERFARTESMDKFGWQLCTFSCITFFLF